MPKKMGYPSGKKMKKVVKKKKVAPRVSNKKALKGSKY